MDLFKEFEEFERELHGGSQFEPIRANLEQPHFMVHPDLLEEIKQKCLPGDCEEIATVMGTTQFSTNKFFAKYCVMPLNPAAKELMQQYKFQQFIGG